MALIDRREMLRSSGRVFLGAPLLASPPTGLRQAALGVGGVPLRRFAPFNGPLMDYHSSGLLQALSQLPAGLPGRPHTLLKAARHAKLIAHHLEDTGFNALARKAAANGYFAGFSPIDPALRPDMQAASTYLEQHGLPAVAAQIGSLSSLSTSQQAGLVDEISANGISGRLLDVATMLKVQAKIAHLTAKGPGVSSLGGHMQRAMIMRRSDIILGSHDGLARNGAELLLLASADSMPLRRDCSEGALSALTKLLQDLYSKGQKYCMWLSGLTGTALAAAVAYIYKQMPKWCSEIAGVTWGELAEADLLEPEIAAEIDAGAAFGWAICAAFGEVTRTWVGKLAIVTAIWSLHSDAISLACAAIAG